MMPCQTGRPRPRASHPAVWLAFLTSMLLASGLPGAPGVTQPPRRPVRPPIGPVSPHTPAPAGPIGEGKAMSEGDGPPIDLTVIGLQVPATVHVKALPPGGAAAVPVTAPGGAATAPSAPAAGDASPLLFRYEWDFGDPAGRWNVLPGWNAAHVYDKPGKYTITLTVTDEAGKSTHRTTWARVGPDDRRKVYCSAAGDDHNNGLSPPTAVRSAQRAIDVGHDDADILFRRGDTFDVSKSIGIHGRGVRLANYDDISPALAPAAVAPATGAPPAPVAAAAASLLPLPKLRKVEGPAHNTSMFFVQPTSRDVFAEGLEFDSQWDLKSQYGAAKVPARAFTVGGANFTVRDCVFRNLSDGINNEMKPVGCLVQDNYFSPEIRGYCIYGEGADHVYVGNVMTHSRQEHLIRCSEPGVTRLLVAYNDLSRPNNGKGSIELRCANWFYVAGNHIDGGTMRVGPQEQNKQQVPNWRDIKCTWGVVQDNRFDHIFCNVRLGTEHLIFRNNVIHQGEQKDNNWGFAVACTKPGYDDVRHVVDLHIEHNTVVNPGPVGQFLVVDGRPQGITLKDNLYVAPHLHEETNNGAAAAVFLFENEVVGFERIENNVWPTRAVHHFGKADHGPADWARLPVVKNDRFGDVAIDPEDNPPPSPGAAGAKVTLDPRVRTARVRLGAPARTNAGAMTEPATPPRTEGGKPAVPED